MSLPFSILDYQIICEAERNNDHVQWLMVNLEKTKRDDSEMP